MREKTSAGRGASARGMAPVSGQSGQLLYLDLGREPVACAGSPVAPALLSLQARHVRSISGRPVQIFWVVEQAAATHQDIAGLKAEMTDNRHTGTQWVAATLAGPNRRAAHHRPPAAAGRASSTVITLAARAANTPALDSLGSVAVLSARAARGRVSYAAAALTAAPATPGYQASTSVSLRSLGPDASRTHTLSDVDLARAGHLVARSR